MGLTAEYLMQVINEKFEELRIQVVSHEERIRKFQKPDDIDSLKNVVSSLSAIHEEIAQLRELIQMRGADVIDLGTRVVKLDKNYTNLRDRVTKFKKAVSEALLGNG